MLYLVFVKQDGAAGAAGLVTLDSVWSVLANANARIDELGDDNATLKTLA